MKNNYDTFLATKAVLTNPAGFEIGLSDMNPKMFPFQKDIGRWAIKRGRAAIFAGCGLGKTLMQLEWAWQVHVKTGGKVLILAPLAVAAQTVVEGQVFGYSVTHVATQSDVQQGINITNYEKLHHFDPSEFTGIVLDESSILKSHDGKFRNLIIESFSATPYKLACSATPAPNDYMEIGNHAEFLGIMSRVEMLAMFFTHDGGDTSKWVLKGHAAKKSEFSAPPFYEWLASWAVMMQKPSDLGYEDGAFILPPLETNQHVIESSIEQAWNSGILFPTEAKDMLERGRARKSSVEERVAKLKRIVEAEPNEPWLIWCNLNSEGDLIEESIEGAVQISGSDSVDFKEKTMLAFTRGEVLILVSKPKICGYGMNWQHCARVAFVGLSDSWEMYYQAIRRCWRFGQNRTVVCHVITAETEGAVVSNIDRKETQAMEMQGRMVEAMRATSEAEVRGASRDIATYGREVAAGDEWTLHLGDCVEVVKEIKSSSVGYTIFSPPFASLYTYSNSDRDMGNCKSDDEFYTHFDFLIGELLRVTMPGRLLSFHCMNLPRSKERDGVIGIRDFRGEMIRLFEAHGWIFHSEVCIWKDPVTAMQRTKALGLLHKQVVKDSAMSRQGIPDYLVTMRKPGVNPIPISGPLASYAGDNINHNPTAIDIWQRYASPVWMDVRPTRTLQRLSAKEDGDERHICPLQLDVIERGVQLWSLPGDLVLSPFAGIGSEGYVALQMGRRFVGAELKRSYWEVAAQNLRLAAMKTQHELFSFREVSDPKDNLHLQGSESLQVPA